MSQPSDDPAELASALRTSLVRIARTIRQQQSDSALTLGPLSALGTLSRQGPMSLGELAVAERVKPPSMTKIVGSLEELGYVERRAHPTDRRSSVIVVSDSGRALLDSERRVRDEWLTRHLTSLEPADRAALAQLLPILDRLSGP